MKTFTLTPEEQVERWVEGESIHNGESREVGECCPDMSCCIPGALQPRHVRELFRDSDERAREPMLLAFLGNALAADGGDENTVYVAGDSGSAIDTGHGWGECAGCGKDDDRRMGYCFECATRAEEEGVGA